MVKIDDHLIQNPAYSTAHNKKIGLSTPSGVDRQPISKAFQSTGKLFIDRNVKNLAYDILKELLLR